MALLGVPCTLREIDALVMSIGYEVSYNDN